MSEGEGESEATANVKKAPEEDTEPVVTHPDYERVGKTGYRHIKSGQFASKAEVVAAVEASKAAAARAEAARMADHHKIRLPTWNPAKPRLWFKECEKIFKMAKVGDTEQETKATLVLRELPAAIKNTIEQQILDPKVDTEYEDLKKAVLKQHQQSPEEAWIEFNTMSLGDQKPSALGQAMLALHPEKCDMDATTGCPHKKWHTQNAFKAKLPQSVRNGLVGTKLDIKDPTAYLAEADELMASARIKQMATRAVNEVTKDGEVDAVGTRGGGKASGNKQRATKTKDVCWAHAKFKRKTWKCMEPTTCKFANQLAPKPDPTKKEQKE